MARDAPVGHSSRASFTDINHRIVREFRADLHKARLDREEGAATGIRPVLDIVHVEIGLERCDGKPRRATDNGAALGPVARGSPASHRRKGGDNLRGAVDQRAVDIKRTSEGPVTKSPRTG